MKETLKPIIEQAITQLQQGADWLSGEIPLYIQELLKWHYTASLATFVAASSIIVVYGLWMIHAVPVLRRVEEVNARREENKQEALGHPYIPLSIVGGLLALMSFLFFICGNFTWLKILIAPRVFLVEYLSNLM